MKVRSVYRLRGALKSSTAFDWSKASGIGVLLALPLIVGPALANTSAVVGNETEYVGGLVGYNGGAIDESYSIGAVTGSGSDVGGLVGFNAGGAAVIAAYWDTQTSGQSTSAGGKGRTTAQLQDGLPNGFDPTIWGEDVSINDGLPYLLALPPP